MKLLKDKTSTKNCYLCKNAIDEWLPAILANRKIFEFKKGEHLFNEGDLVEGMYFVYAGNIKVHKKWGDKELILRFASPGSILGHRGLSSTNKNYPISATAVENGILGFITTAFFNSTLKVNPNFSYNLLMFFADELQESERKMRNLAHMSVKGRLARALLSFKNQFGLDSTGVLNIKLSKQDMASYVGATYETLFRMMNELIAEETIETNKRFIKIINEEKLIELSQKEA